MKTENKTIVFWDHDNLPFQVLNSEVEVVTNETAFSNSDLKKYNNIILLAELKWQ